MQARHFYSLQDNDPNKSLCGDRGLVRMIDTDVDCSKCLSRLAEIRNNGHSTYPHAPGYLPGCPQCDFTCHCGPGVKRGEETECVWIGHEESDPNTTDTFIFACPDCGRTNLSVSGFFNWHSGGICT